MTNEQIIGVIKSAKHFYINGLEPYYPSVWGLCTSFVLAFKRYIDFYYAEDIINYIPEFHEVSREFDGKFVGNHNFFWWDEDEYEEDRANPKNPRIKVLNRLIEIYEEKMVAENS